MQPLASARIVNGPFEANTYLVPVGAGRCLVIDPGLDHVRLTEELSRFELAPSAVLCTHGHFDHIAGAAVVQRRYDTPVYLHRADERVARSANFLMMAFRLTERIDLPEFTWVDDQAVVRSESLAATFSHAPGHTPGSCVVSVADEVFTGDTLYARGVGLMKLPGEDAAVLSRTLRRLWTLIADTRMVCPGHGESARMSDVKLLNAPLRQMLGLPEEYGGERARVASSAPDKGGSP